MQELRQILKEVLNMGMNLKQDQLNGFSRKSGIEMLNEYIQENEVRINKILKIDSVYEIGNGYKIGDMVAFTNLTKHGYGYKNMAGEILNITNDKLLPYEIKVCVDGIYFIDYFDEFEFEKL